ncbi:hypothetical protein [Marinobacter sp. ST-43]|nr:hypothetical protein [Marinobacter sp. ST-43]
MRDSYAYHCLVSRLIDPEYCNMALMRLAAGVMIIVAMVAGAVLF